MTIDGNVTTAPILTDSKVMETVQIKTVKVLRVLTDTT